MFYEGVSLVMKFCNDGVVFFMMSLYFKKNDCFVLFILYGLWIQGQNIQI